MRTTMQFGFILLLFVTLLTSALCYLNYRRQRRPEFSHLTELWFALATMVMIGHFFSSENEHVVAISMIGWLWPLKAFLQVMEDLSGMSLKSTPKLLTLAGGAFLTLALASYGQPFVIYTIPFSFAMALVGITVIAQVYKNRTAPFSILRNGTFVLFLFFFALRMTYPMWRMNDEVLFAAVAANLLVIIGLATCTPSLFMEDIKEKHNEELQAIIKERNEQLFSQSKYSELGMMSAGIAHEINNPLAIIQAKTTQLLRIYKDPDKQQALVEGLQQILYTSERINRTIQGVRSFVHQEETPPNEVIPLKQLVDDVLAFCGQRMKNHGVNLRFYGLENFTLRGHRIQLEQVLLNLLNNSFDALEYLPDKWIEMSVHDTAETIQIYFKDSGPGIPPEIASRIMEPFFTTKKAGKGTGLGLALARGIVEKHGGSLVYISNARHTTFLMEMPKDISQRRPLPKADHQPMVH